MAMSTIQDSTSHSRKVAWLAAVLGAILLQIVLVAAAILWVTI
jgi:hypothetical protein